MKTLQYTISPAIFAKCPGYVRGLVVATGLSNTGSSAEIAEALRLAEAGIKLTTTLESLVASARIASWRDAFRQFGVNPSEFRPAHEALSRRAIQGKPLPNINPAVDTGNMMSLKHLMPVGVHPFDDVVGDLSLCMALGLETFVGFGSDKTENPKPGEPIFAEGNTVLARGWVWRQAKCSVTLPTTKNIIVHVDALPPSDISNVLSVCAEVQALLSRICGAVCTTHVLDAAHNTATLTAS